MNQNLKFFVVVALAFLSAWARAQAPTLDEMLRLPRLANTVLSESGRYLAAVMPVRGRMNLVSIDLESMKPTVLTSYEAFDVQNVVWVGDDRILYTLGQLGAPTGPGEFFGGGLFAVRRDGSEQKRLSPTIAEAINSGSLVYRQMQYQRRVPGSTTEVIVAGNLTAAESTDLYRLNLDTGKTQIITQGRPTERTVSWLLDSKLVPRVVTALSYDFNTYTVYYRAGPDAPWEKLTTYNQFDGNILVPLAIEADDKTLQVANNTGRDTMAVFRYDTVTKKLGELIAGHPRFDMGADQSGQRVPGVVTNRDGKLLGYSVEADRPEVVWIDEERAKLQKTIDTALPSTINTVTRAGTSSKYLVTSYSDIAMARWYLFDEEKRKLEEIGAARPWLDGKLPQQRTIRFKTRDGLEIPGYLFLPTDYKPGTKLPTVVHIHGGPFARADGFASGFGVREGRLFATRGYAVVVPNFRVTPGLGQKIFSAGLGEIGRKMSEDHEDALKWAIDEGYTDPKRACISGASYGGYAALQAMVKTPDLFKCAVAGLAVTDLEYQNTSLDTDYVRYGRDDNRLWKAVMGVKSFSEPIVRAISPVNNAAKIKGAVFLYAGEDDSRVPIPQINRMERALRAAGNPAKAYVVKEREGHGFGKLENNIDLYTQVLKFLDEQIGSKSANQ
jgi:dipeptidyl aminopeptidase/acylaminoacyl peptidase